MKSSRTLLRHAARIAIVTSIVGATTGCVKRHDDTMTTSIAATAPSTQGAYGSTGQRHDHGTAGTIRESDRVPASGGYHAKPTHHATTAPSHGALADRHLTLHVKRALAANNQTSSVGVTAHRGVVTLTGHVHKESQKRKATELAHKVAGVKHVHNHIRVGR